MLCCLNNFTISQIYSILDPSSPHRSKRQEILDLLIKDRSLHTSYYARQQVTYRNDAEAVVAGGEGGNFYRIEWCPGPNSNSAGESLIDNGNGWSGKGKLRFQLLGQDEVAAEDEDSLFSQWQEYMEEYARIKLNEGPGRNSRGPWLKR